MSAGGLAIVIVTCNSASVIGRCLAALGPELCRAVVAVDNASADTSRDILRAAGARVLASPTNEGFARAANLGAREADAAVLCFLNPDCEMTPEVARAGEAALDGHVLACAAPDLLEPGGAVAGRQPGYSLSKLFADVVEGAYGGTAIRGVLRRLPGYDDASWSWPHGACVFVRRDTFLSLGGFPDTTFMYMEDVAFGWRLSRAGGEVVSLPHQVPHGGAAGAAIPVPARRRLLREARLQYAAARYGWIVAGLLRGVTIPGRLARRLVRPGA
ncbi:MAG: glycosyltransferase [Vicinamibacterales bacterium]